MERQWEHYLTRPFTLLGASLWQAWYSSREIWELVGISTPHALFVEVHPDVVRFYRYPAELDALKGAVRSLVQDDPDKLARLFETGVRLNEEAGATLNTGADAYASFEDAVDALIHLALHATVMPFLAVAAMEKSDTIDPHMRETGERLRSESLYPRFVAEIVHPHAERLVEESGLDGSLAGFATLSELRRKDFSALLRRAEERREGKRFVLRIEGDIETVEWISDPFAIVRALEPDMPEHASEIRGAVAYKGNARGTARLVLTNDPKGVRFDEGDILVSINSTPALMPLIRKAAAIVTDEGGIACHAAIVSRELKKPCVIGTKIATQALRNGDIVEVDAEKGIIRVIK